MLTLNQETKQKTTQKRKSCVHRNFINLLRRQLAKSSSRRISLGKFAMIHNIDRYIQTEQWPREQAGFRNKMADMGRIIRQ